MRNTPAKAGVFLILVSHFIINLIDKTCENDNIYIITKLLGESKMILSQTTGCASKFGDIKAIEMLAKAGFDAIDYSMASLKQYDCVLASDEYKKYVNKLCEAAKRNNICFNQGHALSYIYHEDPTVAHKLLIERNIRAIEIAGLMGMKTLIVHPIESGDYIGNEGYVFEKNMEYYKTLLPYAEEKGVKIACENMWCGDKKRGVTRGSVCSNPYEHAYYVDEMNSDMFVACLDVGHSSLAGREAQDCIRVLDGKRLQALHIHDNDYKDDMHTLPGLSEMNWEEITKALADINFQGDFTLETDHFFDSLCTVEETEAGLKLSELVGRKMIGKIAQYSKK